MAVVVQRLRGHAFEAAVAAANVLAGVAWLTFPSVGMHSAVGRSVHPLDYAWSVLYIVGGTVVLVTLARERDLRWRAAGLLVMATGLVMQGTAAVTFALEPRALTYFVYAIACVMRAAVCWCLIRAGRRA